MSATRPSCTILARALAYGAASTLEHDGFYGILDS